MLKLIGTMICNVIGWSLGIILICSILAIIIGLPIIFRKEEVKDERNNF